MGLTSYLPLVEENETDLLVFSSWSFIFYTYASLVILRMGPFKKYVRSIFIDFGSPEISDLKLNNF